MIIPIRCFTCGKVLADKYDYYVKEAEKLQLEIDNKKLNTGSPPHKPDIASTKGKSKEAKGKEAKEKEANDAALEEQHATRHFDTIRTGELLNSMGLTRYCCRRHMLGTVDMMEII